MNDTRRVIERLPDHSKTTLLEQRATGTDARPLDAVGQGGDGQKLGRELGRYKANTGEHQRTNSVNRDYTKQALEYDISPSEAKTGEGGIRFALFL
ncbi:MAG: hypothetical protein JXA82_16970 [Sedimentisphaerales bacterium]|nr:hypothetical protein [Sedimentisphaerales bacterium]